METEQERGDWVNPWPEDGESCPECHHGLLEVTVFGDHDAPGYEVHAWCVGTNGIKLEDADDDDENGCGCGWEAVFYPNRTFTLPQPNEPTSQTDRPAD